MFIRVAAEAVNGSVVSIFKFIFKSLTNGRVRHNDHYVSVWSEDIYKSGKIGVFDFH